MGHMLILKSFSWQNDWSKENFDDSYQQISGLDEVQWIVM